MLFASLLQLLVLAMMAPSACSLATSLTRCLVLSPLGLPGICCLDCSLFLSLARCLAGIIGAGRIGQVHLETLASVPGVKPVIISDVVEPVLKMVTEKYGVPKYTLDVSLCKKPGHLIT